MFVRIYSNGDIMSEISDVYEFEFFKKSLLDLLKEDETIKNYLTKIIEDEKAKKVFETLVLMSYRFSAEEGEDTRLLVEITDDKKCFYVEDYTDRAIVALSLLDVLNTYGVKKFS